MNGSDHIGGDTLGIVDPVWSISTVADLDHSGELDFLWQNTSTGFRFLWIMKGTAHQGGIDLGGVQPN